MIRKWVKNIEKQTKNLEKHSHELESAMVRLEVFLNVLDEKLDDHDVFKVK